MSENVSPLHLYQYLDLSISDATHPAHNCSYFFTCFCLCKCSHVFRPSAVTYILTLVFLFFPFQCTVQVKLELGHRAQLRKKVTSEGFTHDWMVFVRGPETGDIQHFIERVVFRLHDSFPKPKRGKTRRITLCKHKHVFSLSLFR